MSITITQYYSRIRYFTSPSERPGEAYHVIGGGENNCVGPAINHSSIFSGKDNIVTGSCSSILGGSGNSDGGFNYVGIFGQNVTGVMNNAFHTEEIILTNIPVLPTSAGFGSLVQGQLYTICAPGTGYMCSPIFIA